MLFTRPTEVVDNLKKTVSNAEVERFMAFSTYVDEIKDALSRELSASSDVQLRVIEIAIMNGEFDLSDYPNTVGMNDLNPSADDSPGGSILKGNEFRKVVHTIADGHQIEYLDFYDAFAPFFALNLNARHNNEYLFLDPRNN